MKKRATILLLILMLAVVATSFSACDKDEAETPAEEPYVTALSVSAMPERYYAAGDDFDLSNGELTAEYSNGVKKTVKMTDVGVEFRSAGTAVTDVRRNMQFSYGGQSVILEYFVGSRKISDVKLEGDVPTTYVKDGKARLKGVDMVITYADAEEDEAPERVPLSTYESGYTESYLNKNFVSISGFDTSKLGEFTLTIACYLEEFSYKCNVIATDWIIGVSLSSATPMAKAYFVGEPLQINGATLSVKYTNKTENVPITADMITGFSTATASVEPYKAYVKYSGFDTPVEFNYTVLEQENITISVTVQNSVLNYNVNDEIDFEKLRSNLKINVYKDDKFVKTVYGNYPDVDVTCGGLAIEDVVNTEFGRAFLINVTYKDVYAFTDRQLQIDVIKSVVDKSIDHPENIVLSYDDGETFDFGGAKMIFTYDDGTTTAFDLQAEYQKDMTVLDGDGARKVGFWTISGNSQVPVQTFDMSVGTHDEYFITVYNDAGDGSDIVTRYALHYVVS